MGELLNHGGAGVRGDATTVCNTGRGADFEAATGAGYRMICDLGESPAGLWAVDCQSQSGHPGSPHYSDQFHVLAGRDNYHFRAARPEPSARRAAVYTPSRTSLTRSTCVHETAAAALLSSRAWAADVSVVSVKLTLKRPSAGEMNSQCGTTALDWCTSSNPPSDWLTVWIGNVQTSVGTDGSIEMSTPSHSSIRPIRSTCLRVENRLELAELAAVAVVVIAVRRAGGQSREIELDGEMEPLAGRQVREVVANLQPSAGGGFECNRFFQSEAMLAGHSVACENGFDASRASGGGVDS